MFTICHAVTKGVEFFRTTILKMEDQQLFVLFIFIFDILEPRFKFQFILLCLNIYLLFFIVDECKPASMCALMRMRVHK